MRSITSSQTIASADASFQIAAPSTVYVNTMALHTSSSTWGSDAMSFNPARWLRPDTPEPALITPPQGTFLPWSVGPRICPGQKMSQVEFVAVIATLFHRCSARPIAREGESTELARERLLNLLQDSQPVLTLQLNRPEDLHIDWVKRCVA
jgi:cytochrome P450